jgi:Rhs element Vgr protein
MADESVLTNRTTDLVTFTILVNNEEVSREYSIISITVSNEINRIPRAKIIISDGDVAEGDFQASNTDLFIPGNEIEIKAGYHSEEETIFKGIIIRHGIKVKSAGRSTLVIDCKDKAVKLTAQRKSAYYNNIKDSDLLSEIISDYDLTADVEDTSFEHPELVKFNCTDWDFLITRAEVNGLLTIVDDGSITVASPDMAQDSVFTLSYGTSLMEFEAEMDAANQVSSVKSVTWDLTNQELLEEEGTAPGYTEQGNFTIDDLSAILNSNDLVQYHGGDIESEQLQKWADAKFIKSHLAKIKGRARFQGSALVKPGKLVTFERVGDRFNGNAFVSAVVHQIFNGEWLTDIQIGLSPQWFSKTSDIIETQASGLLPAINGLHIGKVVQIGEDDKDGYHRIMIRLPFVESVGATDAQGIWARTCNVFAGDKRGMIFRPEIDDEVLIGFINDDPRDPVILGALNSGKSPAPIEASDDNFEKGIYTLGEMKLVFNDDEKSVLIETKSGNSVLLSEKEAGIVITDENQNSITMSSDGIEIKSAKDILLKAPQGDIKAEANNIEEKANMNYKASGSAGSEVSASGNTVIKGAMVQIN